MTSHGEFSIHILLGKVAKSLVDPFYELHGRKTRARDSDIFFVGFLDNQVVAAVRFCIEEDTPLLRGMIIHEKFRRHRLGTRVLEVFREYLDKENIRNTFCLPYTHLEKFYGQIGFEKVLPREAPQFLVVRIKQYIQEGNEFIVMRKP